MKITPKGRNFFVRPGKYKLSITTPTFDIHARVNYAVIAADLKVDGKKRVITLDLKIDLTISSVIDYFEIFLTRIIMCRRAVEFLDSQLIILINGLRIL